MDNDLLLIISNWRKTLISGSNQHHSVFVLNLSAAEGVLATEGVLAAAGVINFEKFVLEKLSNTSGSSE